MFRKFIHRDRKSFNQNQCFMNWGGGKTRTIRNGSADIQTARGRKRDHADSAMHFSMGIFRPWMGEIRGLL